MARLSQRIGAQRPPRSMKETWIVMSLLLATTISLCTANAVASSTAASSLDQKSTSLGSAAAAGTSTQSAPATPHHLAHGHTKDDIYIDDEGSGGHGGHRDDIEGEPDYSGSGFGPDDEDSVTHSRQNNHNKNTNNRHSTIGGNTGVGSSSGKGSASAKNNNNNNPASGSGGFAGSGDGGFGDIRGENDDDEDNTRFRVHSVPSSGTGRPTVQSTPDDDLEIDEGVPTKDNTGLNEGGEEDEEEEGEEEDVDVDEDPVDGEEDDDLIGHGEGNLDKDFGVNQPAVDPTTTDDEDLGIVPNGEDTIQRGLDKHPDDKSGLGSGAAGGVSGGTAAEKGNEVFIMNAKNDDRTTSFFSQPGILAAVIGGAVVGLLCAILVVMFIVYRMRKKDEGSYALDEPKRSPAVNSYAKNTNNREFYA